MPLPQKAGACHETAGHNPGKKGTVMTDNNDFAEKIRHRLSLHDQGKTERKQQIDGEMKQLLDERERFAVEARRLVQTMVVPRMQQLVSAFPHARLLSGDETATQCLCEFPHTPQFPATAAFSVGFSQGVAPGTLDAYFETKILPIHIEYEKHGLWSFTPGSQSEKALAGWIEEAILSFIDTYLQLETHPSYQRENFVRDPVCGMEISMNDAAGMVERGKQTFYFCSDACRQAFLRNHT